MLKNFTAALERHKSELGYNQFWRYSKGRVPKLLIWLLERPDLVQALATDATDLAKQRKTADDTTASRMAS